MKTHKSTEAEAMPSPLVLFLLLKNVSHASLLNRKLGVAKPKGKLKVR